MSLKGLKSAIARPSARESLAAANVVAQEAGLPPASLSPIEQAKHHMSAAADDAELVQVNIRVRRALGDQLADRARVEGTTQKVLVCRALAGAGFDVHPDDLKVTPTPRRRGRVNQLVAID
jgi:hypothetical protein